MELYSEKMEALIKAALADGELTDKERQVLMRKAAEEGIDQDEFEMVLNARLFEIQKEHQVSSPVLEKKIRVRTCPNCGATIGDNYLTCPECGFAFINESSTSESVRDYLKQFDEEFRLIKTNIFNYNNTKRVDKITSLRVPNTKEALIQAIIYCVSKYNAINNVITSTNIIHEKKAWKAKALQFYAMIKAQPNLDQATKAFIEQYAYLEKKSILEKLFDPFKM